jgi:hypothetical protein
MLSRSLSSSSSRRNASFHTSQRSSSTAANKSEPPNGINVSDEKDARTVNPQIAPKAANVTAATFHIACVRFVASWLTYLPDSPKTFAIISGALLHVQPNGHQRERNCLGTKAARMLP